MYELQVSLSAHLAARYFKKNGMSCLILFDCLYLNLMENLKNVFTKEMGGSSPKLAKNVRFGTICSPQFKYLTT